MIVATVLEVTGFTKTDEVTRLRIGLIVVLFIPITFENPIQNL